MKKKTRNSGSERGKVLGFEGGVINFGGKLFDTLMLGILWLLCSIPLVTVGVSTTALYYAVTHSVKADDGYASTMFFRSFRRNLKQGILLWIGLVAVFVLMRLNTGILMAKTSGNFGLAMIGFYTAVMVYLAVMACYMFPALSRFEMRTLWFVQLSIYMGIRYFLTSAMLLVILGGAAVLVWRVPFLILIVPGPDMWLMSEFLERVLKKHEESIEKQLE